jgi:hypothetical protein
LARIVAAMPHAFRGSVWVWRRTQLLAENALLRQQVLVLRRSVNARP